MKNREIIFISAIVAVSLAILIGLFIYQKGQRSVIENTLTTKDGINITLHEATFRPSNSDYENIIIKADVINTSNTTNYLSAKISQPSQPSSCYNYNTSDYQNYYSNNINININTQNNSTTGQTPSQSPKITIPEICLDYYKQMDTYNYKLSQSEKNFDENKFILYTPNGAIAESDYATLGGKKDLYNVLNDRYYSLRPQESIPGVFVFKITGNKTGIYKVKYRGSQINFEVK